LDLGTFSSSSGSSVRIRAAWECVERSFGQPLGTAIVHHDSQPEFDNRKSVPDQDPVNWITLDGAQHFSVGQSDV